MHRTGFQLDLNLCTGCGACVVACAVENELPWGTSWRWVDTFNEARLPEIPVHHLSLACNHCREAPCARACPAAAYTTDPVTGAVLLDAEKCVGCRYCTWACPYDAPKYDPAAGVVTKCTFCYHRQARGLSPACVGQCPTGALRAGPLAELEGVETVPGFPATGARPSIRFIPLREGAVELWEDEAGRFGSAAAGGEGSSGLAPGPGGAEGDAVPLPPRDRTPRASFRSEWPLWVFTLVVAVLAGITATPAGRAALPWTIFLGAAAVAAAASTLHLGRKARAWRAVLGWRTSWLSREVLLFNAFAAVGVLELSGFFPALVLALGTDGGQGAHSVVRTLSEQTGWLLPLLGLATLYAMDRVYSVTRSPGVERHSARTLLTGLLVAGVVAGTALLWAMVLLLKLLLYGARKQARRASGTPWRRRLSALRVGSALVGASLLLGGTPVSGILLGPGSGLGVADGWMGVWLPQGLAAVGLASPWMVVGAVLLLLGEAVDRGEFYAELEIPSPARQVRTDLLEAVRELDSRRLGA